MITTHHLVPSLRMSRSYTPPVGACMAVVRQLYFYCIIEINFFVKKHSV
jgi:hypothetical protein